MEFLDARRLTGPNAVFNGIGSVLDVACSPDEARELVPVWADKVGRMLEALDWPSAVFASRELEGGVSLAFSAPIDQLYAASEINEWAWAASAHELGALDEAPDFDEALAALRKSAAEEANVELMWLIDEARARGKTLLWDDDEVSVGLGKGSQTWNVREIPDAPDWDAYHDVPVGIVTGTNGKTTSVRFAKHILRTAGHNVGVSSTDWIAVNEDIIDRDDWSGPGGARAVLRRPEIDVAILETARGGLLRRGLGVERADAALITNISEDHLGDFGSRNLDELLDIKWVLSHAVRDSGRLVLNADDARLVDKARDYSGEIVWFSLDAGNPVVVAHDGPAFVLEGGELQMLEGGGRASICRSDEIPIALGGAARHNVANALAAAALTWCMGVPLDAIRDGLTTMQQDENPGRCNVYDLDGVKVLIDFAHNPAAMAALFDMARAIPAGRRALCFGQAGDRTDELIRELARDAWAIGLDRVVVSELAKYHRGRERGEVFHIIRDELLENGATEDAVVHHETELESFQDALDWARPGDLVIMLALGGAAPVQAKLAELGAR
ncbi:MAG: Mur ligase [Gammaproteobacteria bacterium]|nr:Mur ligase [Gammaproteobacteria bacterium]NNF50768.1 Mur ligase [Woeseiaceae bacterium]MBT8094395.1 Mur ligase [Gammaproteobacteria bacterium]MBT8104969.1 Mur ligase [Gammaproteobacteria bacterium]NNK24983.1 Mur ligase [Woeseiaceae bacterium]